MRFSYEVHIMGEAWLPAPALDRLMQNVLLPVAASGSSLRRWTGSC
jgi:hypothetical protein